jgi:cell wall assembly regulator SMI1
MQFGVALPAAVRDSYLTVDGQEAESSAGCAEGLFFGLTLLPLEDVLEEWRFWREVDDDPATGANTRLRDGMRSIPDGWVHKEYSQRGWIPLIVDKAGNYIGVDLNPAVGGSVGQVIVFGRDFDTKVVLWRGDGPAGWAKWLASFVDELESGEGYELGGNDVSEGSEDGLGYESYYYDGTGRGQGDGGGDTSSGGGLKLTGEYRGWNVLEAWADRSVRKWHESGVFVDASLLPQEKPKVSATQRSTFAPENGAQACPQATQKPGLGILSLAKTGDNSATEVIMPVLADVDEDEEQFATAPSTHDITTTPLPIINITKPPAPTPIFIPTTHDIVALPSPPDSTHSSLDLNAGDLESGLGISMRQVPNSHMPAARKSPKSQPATAANVRTMDIASAGPALIPLPVSPDVSLATEQLPNSGSSDITDLLDDPTPVMENIPIEPASPRATFNLEPIRKETRQDLDILVSNGPLSSTDPDTTIRLVGGGGTAGPADEDLLPPNGDLAAEVTSKAPGTSNDSVPAGKTEGKQAKHKKTISSGLKKIGQLGGGKRKTDMVINSSAKDVSN